MIWNIWLYTLLLANSLYVQMYSQIGDGNNSHSQLHSFRLHAREQEQLILDLTHSATKWLQKSFTTSRFVHVAEGLPFDS